MAGMIKKTIDTIIEKRAHGNPTLVSTTITKLILKGIDPNKYNSASDDDPVVLDKLKRLATELNISI